MTQPEHSRSQRPELFADLALHVASTIREVIGVDADTAEQVGNAVANTMMDVWGGQSVYFPKGVSYLASTRDYQIYSECNGRNHADLARKYNLTLQWVYKVVKKVQKAETARVQMDMFTSGSD